MKKPSQTIGLNLCSLGWHRRPFDKEPRPAGVTHEDYRFHSRCCCVRCVASGRLDPHGNLVPDRARRAAS